MVINSDDETESYFKELLVKITDDNRIMGDALNPLSNYEFWVGVTFFFPEIKLPDNKKDRIFE